MRVRKPHVIGIGLALIHFLAFLATVMVVESSYQEQAEFLWLAWIPIDFPISCTYLLLGDKYSQIYHALYDFNSALGSLLYAPHFVHGFLGTVWWYLIPQIISSLRERVTRKRAG